MKTKELIKKIKGLFKKPVKKYYFGRIRHFTPYFEPMGFHQSIISVRRLKRLSKEQLAEYKERGYGWAKQKYSNMPMVRRSKNFIVRLFGNEYYVRVGKPWAVVRNELGSKEKFNSFRYEWPPSFQIWFFKWQLTIHWVAPEIKTERTFNNDNYYEQILWYLYGYDLYNETEPNIVAAEESWPWRDGETKESTWEKGYLCRRD